MNKKYDSKMNRKMVENWRVLFNQVFETRECCTNDKIPGRT